MQLLKLLKIGIVATAVATMATGCAYRTDLVQGNFVEQEAISQLRAGMSPEQVQYVMGTPMLTDPFDQSRWYYVHFIRKGWEKPQVKNLVLKFEGRSLADIAGDFPKPLDFYSGNVGIQKINLADIGVDPNSVQQDPQNTQAESKE